MSERRYPPLTIEVPDRETGEVRRVEVNYSTLSYDLAFSWSRQLRYFDAITHQWLELLKNITDKEAESSAYQFRREERMKEAV